MSTSTPETPDQQATSVPVTELTGEEARRFFLKSESYCTLELPSYFDFGPLLADIAESLAGSPISGGELKAAGKLEHVNHTIYGNKDGNFDWRPFQLIHPILYVDLVNTITRRGSWELIGDVFSRFKRPRFDCASLPVSTTTIGSDKAQTVNRWWHGFEQRSIQLALEYEYVAMTDIVDCYGSIYTHAIPWAVHSREVAKENRGQSLLGNQIDYRLKSMHYGQTNGIPQGSVLSDFIAEIVLGWVDTELDKRINDRSIGKCKVLRYRDDYRIFASTRGDVEAVLQLLAEAVREAGFKLNVGKTSVTDDVIGASMKAERTAWLMRLPRRDQPLDRLLDIRHHGMEYPGAGSLKRSLTDYFKKLKKELKDDKLGYVSPVTLASVAIDIAARNPRTYPQVSAVLSVLIARCGEDDRESIVNGAVNRLRMMPNSGHMEIWLKEIVRHLDRPFQSKEKMCAVVDGRRASLWDCKWVESSDLRDVVLEEQIVNRPRFEEMKLPFDDDEISLFPDLYGEI